MGRRLEIDAVRGLMLVWMVLTHLPTALPNYTNQPFGFVSASEGFIFLSALFTGRIYFRLVERDGYHLVHWADGDFTYWAVSDVSVGDLQTFQRSFEQQAPPH